MTARRYQYLYAIIDPLLNDMCVEIQDTTLDCSSDPNYIPIPAIADYLFKYYDRATGKWYLESTHITEWIPS